MAGSCILVKYLFQTQMSSSTPCFRRFSVHTMMTFIRKILASVLFTAGGFSLANFAISLRQYDTISAFIFFIIFYVGISTIFGLGAILLWDMKLWKILLRNFIGSVAAFSLFVSLTSPLISKWVNRNYESSELIIFDSLGVDAIFGAIVLGLTTAILNYLMFQNNS